jgi:hypothetical protein
VELLVVVPLASSASLAAKTAGGAAWGLAGARLRASLFPAAGQHDG